MDRLAMDDFYYSLGTGAGVDGVVWKEIGKDRFFN